MDYKGLATKILPLVGGKENISSHTNCMTRLRVNVKDTGLVDVAGLKVLDGVQGVVTGDQTQIIVGPGNAQRLEDAFKIVAGEGSISTEGQTLEEQTKARIKAKQQSPFQRGLKHIGNIFIPLIPGFVGTGLIAAVANVIRGFNPLHVAGLGQKLTEAQIIENSQNIVSNPWFLLFAAVGGSLVAVLHIVVGYNTAKEFGGTPVLGAIAGSIIYLPALTGTLAHATIKAIPAQPLVLDYFGKSLKLIPGLGGVFAVIFAAILFSYIEKQLRKFIPAILDLILVPFLTIMIGGVITILIIMPFGAALMKGVDLVLVKWALEKGGVIGGFFLASTFLPLVMMGIHHALTPVHAALITKEGFTVLLPILAMAGAGQVGCAIAILIKTSSTDLKKTITGALPAGFLGVGEPLIYGVSLPLFFPFITACIGAGFGGAFIAFGKQVGAIAIGPSGLVLIPLINNGKLGWYIGGLLISYAAGFILTYLFGYNNKMLERLN